MGYQDIFDEFIADSNIKSDDPRGRKDEGSKINWENNHLDENDNIKHRKFGTDFTFRRKLVYKNIIGFAALHVAAAYGLYLLLTKTKFNTVIWFIFVVAMIGQGVTAGAHRMWTHRAFKAKNIVKIMFLILFTAAGENCLWVWVRDHRQHHKYSDTDADPHNATRGFFFSHIGWLMSRKHPLVIEMGKKINMKDLDEDPMVMFQKRYYKTLYILFGIILPVIVPVLFWGENLTVSFFTCFVFRQVLILHMTWSVNSVAHMYGTRPYSKKILAVESAFVSIVSNGEGWHNYHHVFPADYKAAELGVRYQGTTVFINLLARLGLVYDLREVSVEKVKEHIKKAQHADKSTNLINVDTADKVVL